MMIPPSELETQRKGKDSRSMKPWQGILFVFLIIAIPIGVYIGSQRQSVADTRSQAKDGPSVVRIDVSNRSQSIAATPTPTPHSTQRCNSSCTLARDCNDESMTCVKVDGVGKCRMIECPDVTDCWCNKTVSCNTTCTDDAACGTGKVCAKINGVGKCRNSQCYGAEDCLCYTIGGTPTPLPTPQYKCNDACTGDTSCGEGKVCVKTADGSRCRNAECYAASDCICYNLLTPTINPLLLASPTPKIVYITQAPVNQSTPTPIPTLPQVYLAEMATPTPTKTVNTIPASPKFTIVPFTDSNRIAPKKFTLEGFADPSAEITVAIPSDAVTGIAQADTTGHWQYTFVRPLSDGSKEMTLTVRTFNGDIFTKQEIFSVRSGATFPVVPFFIGLGIILFGIGAGYGGFIFAKKHAEKNHEQKYPVL